MDTKLKEIVKTYPTGSRPDIALSRDGTRLYVASESRVPEGPEGAGAGRLDVIDTATGATLASVANPHRWVAMGPLYGSEMALSADGHWLYVPKLVPGPEGTASVACRDIRYCQRTGSCRITIPLPKCGASLLVPWPNGGRCQCCVSSPRTCGRYSSAIRAFPRPNRRPSLPYLTIGAARRLGTAFVSGENEVTVLMTDGKYSKVNVQTGTTVQEGEIVVFSAAYSPLVGTRQFREPSTYLPWDAGLSAHGYCNPKEALRSGSRDPISICTPATPSQCWMPRRCSRRASLSSRVLSCVPSWNLFSDAAIGNGGKRLYLLAVERKGGTVRVLSLPDGKEIDTIQGLGTTLSNVVPSP